MTLPRVIIHKGREKPILQRHPWVFSGAIQRTDGEPKPGDLVDVRTQDGAFLARGYWNPRSQIQVRLLTWRDEPIDEGWWRQMLRRAVDQRLRLNPAIASGSVQACRLINAENDFLPGLIVDKYDRWLVLQSLTLGIEQRKKEITHLLAEIIRPMGIFERSDADVRGKEGLSSVNEMLWGVEPPQHLPVQVGDTRFLVDVRKGHKTGFYLDQRENREILRQLLSDRAAVEGEGPVRLLNMFSFTGVFALSALRQYATIAAVNVDASHEALEIAEQNYQLNGIHESQAEFIQADAFDFLRDLSVAGDRFDVIVLDPPKFASSAAQVDKAARGYKDINLHALKSLTPGGYLMTFSCSGAISRDLFQKIVFGALADTGRQAQILRHLSAADDHPVALTFPEGEYLKGLLLKVY